MTGAPATLLCADHNRLDLTEREVGDDFAEYLQSWARRLPADEAAPPTRRRAMPRDADHPLLLTPGPVGVSATTRAARLRLMRYRANRQRLVDGMRQMGLTALGLTVLGLTVLGLTVLGLTVLGLTEMAAG